MTNKQTGDFSFHWGDSTGRSMLTLQNRTWTEALQIAQEMGYKTQVWYRPSTGGNHVFKYFH